MSPPQSRQTVAALGRLDVMVNNAGEIEIAPLVEQTPEGWDRAAGGKPPRRLPRLPRGGAADDRAGRGRPDPQLLVGCRRRGRRERAAYSASKFGVIGLTQSLAVELAPHGITVNAYCPGHVTVTPMWDFIDSELAAARRPRPRRGQGGGCKRRAVRALGTAARDRCARRLPRLRREPRSSPASRSWSTAGSSASDGRRVRRATPASAPPRRSGRRVSSTQ